MGGSRKKTRVTRKNKRSKEWGYEVEKSAEKYLKRLFPTLRRVGSMGYSKAHPDLVQDGEGAPYHLVVTRDKNNPLLVTMSVEDLFRLCADTSLEKAKVLIQVKGRASSWIGRLHRELRS